MQRIFKGLCALAVCMTFAACTDSVQRITAPDTPSYDNGGSMGSGGKDGSGGSMDSGGVTPLSGGTTTGADVTCYVDENGGSMGSGGLVMVPCPEPAQ